MVRKKSKNGKIDEWNRLVTHLAEDVPHVSSWWGDSDDFGELRIKARPDGTVLAIAKGYDSAGGPIVCFGSGYGVEGALMAINSTIQGGHWRVEKPWVPPGKK